MLFIKKLVWDDWNVEHISRHRIVPEEIEEVCRRHPIVQRGTKRNRMVLLGRTLDDRLLSIILENKGKNTYYPITAYDAGPEDETLYQRIRGGDTK